ncbi:hypothetical protein cypCar_00046103, partial [Cyprinus carpio]
DNSGVIIVVIIVSILLLAVLGSVFYFLYKKGKLPCGRSGKQEIINAYSTKEKTNKDDIVVEMKAKKTEESMLLKSANGEKKPPNDQCRDAFDDFGDELQPDWLVLSVCAAVSLEQCERL